MVSRKSFFALAIIPIMLMLVLPVASAQITNCTQECEGKVCTYFFYSPDCPSCQSIEGFMNDFEANYSKTVVLHRFDVTKSENFDIYSKFCSIQNLPMKDRGIPLVVTKDDFLMGTKDIREKLEPSVMKLISENKTGCISEDVCHSINETSTNNTNSQQIITVPLIIAASAADSLNPCAIGVLIFLIGFLMLSSGKNKAKTMKIALLYIFTVYLTYYIAGLGVLHVLSRLGFLKLVNKIFGVGIAILGLINIKDAVQNKPEGTLAIPTAAKPLIERWVYKASIPAAIVLGIIVASVEIPCVGGVYLAILTLMANTMTRATAMAYLALYNLIFVLPLILIMFLFIFGFEAETLQGWLDRHKRKSRAIMGITLMVIGTILCFL